MLTLSIETEPGMARTIVLDEFPCRIGRHRSHPVVLSSWRVARTHAEIRRTGERYAIADLGSLGGTAVNGERVNEYGPLLEGDEIVIGGFLLRVLATEPSPGGTDAARSSGTTPTQSRSGACPAPDDAPLEARRLLHRRLLAQIDLFKSMGGSEWLRQTSQKGSQKARGLLETLDDEKSEDSGT